MRPRRLILIGASGHAKVVAGVAEAAGYAIEAVFDDDERKRGQAPFGVPIAGPIDLLREGHASAAVVGIGDNRVRQAVVARLPLHWVSLAHPHAWIHGSARIGPGAVVCAGAVVQPGASVGAHAIVNTGATVDHDCVVGDYAHVGPGAHLAGGVHIGEGAFVGIGSAVIEGVTIGAWTTVGAGAAVIEDLPPGVVAVGVPATPRTG